MKVVDKIKRALKGKKRYPCDIRLGAMQASSDRDSFIWFTEKEIIEFALNGYKVEAIQVGTEEDRRAVQRFKYTGIGMKLARRDAAELKRIAARKVEFTSDVARDMNAFHDTNLPHDQENGMDVFQRRKKELREKENKA